jgi:hypothetical protein
MLLRLERGDHTGFDDEKIKRQVYLEIKKIMEQSGLCELATNKPKGTDMHLRKQQVKWDSDGKTTVTQMFHCPPSSRFGRAARACQLLLTKSLLATTLEMRGSHGAASHAPEKDQLKFLKFQQIKAILAGV